MLRSFPTRNSFVRPSITHSAHMSAAMLAKYRSILGLYCLFCRLYQQLSLQGSALTWVRWGGKWVHLIYFLDCLLSFCQNYQSLWKFGEDTTKIILLVFLRQCVVHSSSCFCDRERQPDGHHEWISSLTCIPYLWKHYGYHWWADLVKPSSWPIWVIVWYRQVIGDVTNDVSDAILLYVFQLAIKLVCIWSI